MVDWIKSGVLGTKKVFNKNFVAPIKEGEDKDATAAQIKQMKKRSFLLHKRLQPYVDRKDLRTLAADLPAKREYIVTLKMTPFQKFLYKVNN